MTRAPTPEGTLALSVNPPPESSTSSIRYSSGPGGACFMCFCMRASRCASNSFIFAC